MDGIRNVSILVCDGDGIVRLLFGFCGVLGMDFEERFVPPGDVDDGTVFLTSSS